VVGEKCVEETSSNQSEALLAFPLKFRRVELSLHMDGDLLEASSSLVCNKRSW